MVRMLRAKWIKILFTDWYFIRYVSGSHEIYVNIYQIKFIFKFLIWDIFTAELQEQ